MNLKIRTTSDREAVAQYVAALPDGKCYDIVITQSRAKRSLDQNGLYWRIVGIVARETDNDREDIHKFFAKKFLGVESVEVLGERIGRIRSTAKMPKDEFSDYIEKITAFCLTELGIKIPMPDDPLYDQIMNYDH